MATSLVNNEVFVGNVTGTATATTVSLGFKPSYVKVINETANICYEIIDGSTNTTITTGSTGVITYAAAATTNGILTSTGFTFASSASDVCRYIAVR